MINYENELFENRNSVDSHAVFHCYIWDGPKNTDT